MTKRLCFALTVALFVATTAGRADAAVIFYADLASFNAANPGLALEGFQNAEGFTDEFTGPLNSSSDNSNFDPGDILPGIELVDNPGPDVNGMFVAGPLQSSNPTIAVGSNSPQEDALDILFNPGVGAVSFEIFQNFGGGEQSGDPEAYTVSVYGAGNALLGSAVVTVPSGGAGFFGVSSDVLGEILRIGVLGGASAFEVVDNIQFGEEGDVVVPEPATLMLFGVGISAAVARRRRNRATHGQA